MLRLSAPPPLTPSSGRTSSGLCPAFWPRPAPDYLSQTYTSHKLYPTLRFLLRPRPYSVASLWGSHPCLHSVWPMCPGPTGPQAWAGRVRSCWLLCPAPSRGLCQSMVKGHSLVSLGSFHLTRARARARGGKPLQLQGLTDGFQVEAFRCRVLEPVTEPRRTQATVTPQPPVLDKASRKGCYWKIQGFEAERGCDPSEC